MNNIISANNILLLLEKYNENQIIVSYIASYMHLMQLMHNDIIHILHKIFICKTCKELIRRKFI